MVEYGDYNFFFDEQGNDMGLVQESRGSDSKIYRNCRNPQTNVVLPYDYHRLTKDTFRRSYASQAKALEVKTGRKIIDEKTLQLEDNSESKPQLEKRLGILVILSIFGGIFFLSSNLTGNVIGTMTNSTSNILGAVLLVIGLTGSFFWIRRKR